MVLHLGFYHFRVKGSSKPESSQCDSNSPSQALGKSLPCPLLSAKTGPGGTEKGGIWRQADGTTHRIQKSGPCVASGGVGQQVKGVPASPYLAEKSAERSEEKKW